MTEGTTKKILSESLPILFICAVLLVSSGSFLGVMEENFRLIPGLLVMIPPLLALRGNISGPLASRLSSALHQGVMEPRFAWSKEMKANVLSAFFLTLTGSALTGILSYFVSTFTGFVGANLPLFVGIALLAGLISGAIQITLTVSIALTSYIKGLDPDDVTGPIVATLGDFLTLASLYIAVLLLV